MRTRVRLAAALILLLSASALPPATAGLSPASDAGAGASSEVTMPPKTMTRDILVDGTTLTTIDTRTVTLTVSDTRNLKGLQQINVSWVGAHPTGGSVDDPNSSPAAGRLEYPMVLLQCRGVDSPSVAPGQEQLDPTTCWTAYPGERYSYDGSQYSDVTGDVIPGLTTFPPWRLDLYAPPTQRTAYVGLPPADLLAAKCPSYLFPNVSAEHWLPFKAADGTIYYGGPNSCAGSPPEAAPTDGFSLAFPSNETFASSNTSGSGSSRFDIFNADDNASLGCSETVACSLVGVPIMGTSCDAAGLSLPPADRVPSETVQDGGGNLVNFAAQAENDCAAAGYQAPGAGGGSAPLAVSGALWWTASNWRNRITVPLTFAPVQDACSGKSKSGGILWFGSELMAEATSQWDPRFCRDANLFTIRHVQEAEPTARSQLTSGLQAGLPPGSVEGVFSTNPGTYPSPVVNAPVAFTGFAISFAIDDAHHNHLTNLKLNARLLAKLLTESYPDTINLKAGYAPLSTNPRNITLDPEFLTLNPDLSYGPGGNANWDAASTLYALSSDSDVMYALTSYIANDPDARAWLAGAPAPGGMLVNPHYRTGANEISLPTDSWRLLDTYTDKAAALASQCGQYNTSPYLPLVAAPTANLSAIAVALEFATPLSSTNCFDLQTTPPSWALRRQNRQSPGLRFMLAITSLGEAGRDGFDTASLQTNPGTFVGPSDASLQAAAKLLVHDSTTQTWQIPTDAFTKPDGAAAYPGSMLVYAQVPTAGLPTTDASRYAQFLRFAAGDGQTPGSDIGQLPPGYLPMTAANGLGDLAAYTAGPAATRVETQADGILVGPSSTPSPTPSSPSPAPLSSPTPSPSPTSTANSSDSGSAGSSSGSGGGNTANGRFLNGGANAAVPPPLTAPTAPPGPLAVIGKTLGLLSHIGGSILSWLVYIAVASLAGAAAFWVVARRRGVRLGLKGLIAAIREALSGLTGRRGVSR